MKRFLISVVAILLFGSLSAQNVARECVLFEVFTGVNCPYCPAAANGVSQMLEEGLAIAPVAIHTSAFSTSEFYTDETNGRANFYVINGYPTLKADGILTKSGGGNASQSMYSSYISCYNQRINVTSPFTIDLSYDFVEGSVCQVTAVVNKVGQCDAANLRVMIALTESHIQKTWQGMSELNAVTRDFIPTQDGTVFSGESLTVTELFDMAGFPKENMCLVAWVQSFTTKEVFQTVKLSLEPQMVNYDVALRGISTLVTNNCSDLVEPTLTIKTFGTENVTSLDVEVTGANDEMLSTYQWTGNASTGDTIEFSMPEFSLQGSNVVNFNVVKINGNDDAYPFDNYLSREIFPAGEFHGDIQATIKTPKDPEDLVLVIKNMDTDVIVEEYHFEEGNHGYQFDLNIPSTGCYRAIFLNKSGTGTGSGFAKLTAEDGTVIVSLSRTQNPFTYKYVTEFSLMTLDVDENNDVDNNLIYPNPASSELVVCGSDICELSIYNSLGQMVYTKSGDLCNEVVDVKAFENGLYIVNMKKNNGETVIEKVVVKK
ncbi:MAG: T9SS type A sorting domain-containing protein [Candidatus Limimorpha sp.]